MTGKPTNSIDDIFKRSVEPLETEPSEGFWIRASEDSLFKSNLAKRSELNRWKTTAYILGAAIVALAFYVFYNQSQISSIKKQLTNLREKTAFQSAPQQFVQSNADLATSVNKQSALPSTQIIQQPDQPATASSTPVNGVEKYTVTHRPGNNSFVQPKSLTSSVTYVNNGVSATTGGYTAPLQVINNGSEVNSNTVEQVNNTSAGTTFQQKNAVENNSVSTPISSITSPAKVDSAASITISVSNTQPIEVKNFLSKFSASIFYAPYLADEIFENESSDNLKINNVMANEEEQHPYMLGLRIGYDLSPRWSVIMGMYYYNFRVSVDPVTIYAQQGGNGDVGYSFQTSLGTVGCPYSDGKLHIGDGMKINGTVTAHYISIPLQVKYSFINKGRVGFYITMGAAANMVAYRKMNIHWQDSWNNGDAIEGIQSANNVYYSFYAAPGISYRFLKGFSAYIEPSILGSPTFLAKSAGLKGPLFAGLDGGISCHF